MFEIDLDNNIKLTRGDTARITVTIKIKEDPQTTYSIAAGDTVTLSLKKKLKDPEPCMQKIVLGTGDIHIEPTDTKDLDFGKYIYDVQLTKANGDVFTVIDEKIFKITGEVT